MHSGWRESEDVLMRMKLKKSCCQFGSKHRTESALESRLTRAASMLYIQLYT